MRRRLKRNILFLIVGLAILTLLASLPFALKEILIDLSSESYPNYWISEKKEVQNDNHLSVHLDFIEIDEWKGIAKIRVTAYDYCISPCDWTDEITIVSFLDQLDREVLAPAETMQFSSNHWSYTKVIELPVFGDPIRFPFDDYDMKLGILFYRLYKDGRIETVTPEMAKDQLSVTIQSRVPQFVMLEPTILENFEIPIYHDYPQRYDYATDLVFIRHSYLKILTVFLIILIAAVTIYAVFLCDTKSVILSAGGLILGVWGIKAILLSESNLGITATDVILAILVLVLLLAILIRGVFDTDINEVISKFFKRK